MVTEHCLWVANLITSLVLVYISKWYKRLVGEKRDIVYAYISNQEFMFTTEQSNENLKSMEIHLTHNEKCVNFFRSLC